MRALGLSDAQLDQRRAYVGGSDAGKVMSGQWRELWAEKTGRAKPEDLSGNLAVQMGSATEEFNAFWYTKMTGRPVGNRGEFRVSQRHPFMAANLDGITQTKNGFAYWDAKHVGRLDEATVLRYTPQMTHCCTILGLDWWVLSVFIGNSKWEMVENEIDPMYQADLIAKEREFWQFVTDDIEPPEAEAAPVLPPKPQPKLRSIIVPTDDPDVYAALCRSNNWIGDAKKHVEAIIGTDAAAKVWAIHREDMKTLVPEDVGEFVWGRYRLARSRAGAVTQTVAKMEAEDADA
jgi:hypothetical protein